MSATRVTADAVVPADHPCLAGHFPGRPIVPAVVILELVVEALAARLGPLRVTAIASAKFLAPLAPAQQLAIELDIDDAAQRARFRAAAGDTAIAQGELSFARD